MTPVAGDLFDDQGIRSPTLRAVSFDGAEIGTAYNWSQALAVLEAALPDPKDRATSLIYARATATAYEFKTPPRRRALAAA